MQNANKSHGSHRIKAVVATMLHACMRMWAEAIAGLNIERICKARKKLETRCAPVITPDVLCETDVEGGAVVFTIRWIVDRFDVSFGRLVMMICAFSLPPSPTSFVVSAWLDCPLERCWDNAGFGSLDATLDEFRRSLGLIIVILDQARLILSQKFFSLCFDFRFNFLT